MRQERIAVSGGLRPMALIQLSFWRWLKEFRIAFVCAVPALAMLAGIMVFGLVVSEPARTSLVVPQYDKDGALLRPKDFYTWAFAGASIGLSYSKSSDPSG